ncbi:MAG: helix-turn-helix transcriptional regulator [Lachnospiraceae bacterium]|nr:helix-turn-helix transcriptional regulator [Lachnospiraceae bacterium]
MGENFTSRVGYLIRNFRIASDMTQKELADKCGLNESTIRNYELGNRYPDAATLLNIANNLNVSFYALSDPDVANIFSALHVLFDIEWAYGLRPTMKYGELTLKFEERLSSTGPRPQEYLDNFRKMVEYWARLRDRLEDGEITESEYYLKEIKFPMNPVDPDKEYTVSLNLDDDDQLMVQKINEDEETEETAELLKDLFPDFSYVKRKRKPKKE